MLAVGSGLKTRFMYGGGLNSGQLKRYLDLLLNKGLLTEANSETDRTVYRITPQGEKALAKLQEIIDLLRVGEASEFDEALAKRG